MRTATPTIGGNAVDRADLESTLRLSPSGSTSSFEHVTAVGGHHQACHRSPTEPVSASAALGAVIRPIDRNRHRGGIGAAIAVIHRVGERCRSPSPHESRSSKTGHSGHSCSCHRRSSSAEAPEAECELPPRPLAATPLAALISKAHSGCRHPGSVSSFEHVTAVGGHHQAAHRLHRPSRHRHRQHSGPSLAPLMVTVTVAVSVPPLPSSTV